MVVAESYMALFFFWATGLMSSIQAFAGETLMTMYNGGCQCGKVRYEVDLELGEVIACNCSRCGRLGSLLAFAPAEKFTLRSGGDDVTKYEFNRHNIQHYFCSTCGIQSYAKGVAPGSQKAMVAVNVRCLDGVDVATLPVKHVDGRSF
jgi:hypothetical protein